MVGTPKKPAPPDAIYSLVVEMADRVSQRRQAANSFYLSVNTALIGATAYLSQSTQTGTMFTLGLAGSAMCVLWMRNISSYKTLNDAKFRVIHDLERRMPEQPYTEEWNYLDPDGDGKRHTPFHQVERLVPWVFIVVHVLQSAIAFPYWKVIRGIICV